GLCLGGRPHVLARLVRHPPLRLALTAPLRATANRPRHCAGPTHFRAGLRGKWSKPRRSDRVAREVSEHDLRCCRLSHPCGGSGGEYGNLASSHGNLGRRACGDGCRSGGRAEEIRSRRERCGSQDRQHHAYSGPLSAYGLIGKTEAAYFAKINAEGGIHGRKINFISYDDSFSPPKTVEQARKLLESDEVLLIFQALGTPTNTAIQKYMNAKKVPH